MAALDPAILAWALTLPSSNRWRGLAEAFTSGTTRVSFDGRTVEYRSFNGNSQAPPHREQEKRSWRYGGASVIRIKRG